MTHGSFVLNNKNFIHRPNFQYKPKFIVVVISGILAMLNSACANEINLVGKVEQNMKYLPLNEVKGMFLQPFSLNVSSLGGDYVGDYLSVNTTNSYDNVRVSNTITNKWLVNILNSASLTVGNKLNISANDTDKTGYVVGLGVSGNAQVTVVEGTTITINSTSQNPMSDDMSTRYGMNLVDSVRVDIGKDSLISINSMVDGGFVGGAYLSGENNLLGKSLALHLDNIAGDTQGIIINTGNNSLSFERLEMVAKGQSKESTAFTSGFYSYTDETDRTHLEVRDLDITAVGTTGATAIESEGAITISNAGQTTLKTTATQGESSNAYGIYARGNQDGDIAMSFGPLSIISKGAYNATGIALEAQGESNQISSKSMQITSRSAHDSYGLNLKGGQLVVSGALNIDVTGGSYAKGIAALNGNRLEVGKDEPQSITTVNVTGDLAYAVDIGRGEQEADFFNKTIITAQSTGKQAFGVYLRSEFEDDTVPMTGKVIFHNGLKVAVTGGTEDNKAVYAHGPGAEFLVENGFEATAEKTAVFARGSDANAATVVTINQKSGLTQIASNKRAIWAYGNAKVDVGGDVVQIYGNILSVGTAEGIGIVNANFTSSNSYLTGTTSNKSYADITTDGIANLTFASGARWNVTGSSSLNSLTLDDAMIDLTQDGQKYSRLEIADLNGSGTFRLDVDVDKIQNDVIFVGGSTEGVSLHEIDIASSGTASADKSGILVTAVEGAEVAFVLKNKNGIDLGNYLYKLVYSDDSNGDRKWNLEKSGMSPSAEAVLAMAGTGAQAVQFLDRLSDLHKRLGEVRYGVRDGLWASMQGRKDRISGFASTGFKQSVYGVNIGYDRVIGNSWLLGGSFSASRADQKTHGTHFSATGEADSQGMSLYATYMGVNEAYADFVLSVDRYAQDIQTRMLDGNSVKGDYTSVGYGLSGEIGKKFYLDRGDSFFVEPQAQLSWYHVHGKDFELSNDMSVSQDHMDSLNGRLGVLLGIKFNSTEDAWSQVYFKGGINHEFLDDQTIRINDVKYSDDVIGTRAYYGVGLDWQFSRKTRFWAHVEREEGNGYTKEIEANIGIKYHF